MSSQSPTQQPTVLESYGYELLGKLGEGSYGVVKLAYSVRHLSNVAVKILSKKDVKTDYIKKFLPREIDIIKQLKHPYLVVFLEVIGPVSK